MEIQEKSSRQGIALDKERILTALRSSPGGFNSARAQSTGGQRPTDDETFRATFKSSGGFDRQASGSLPQHIQFQMHVGATTSESLNTVSSQNRGEQQQVKQNTYLAQPPRSYSSKGLRTTDNESQSASHVTHKQAGTSYLNHNDELQMYLGGSSTPLHPTSIQPYPRRDTADLYGAPQVENSSLQANSNTQQLRNLASKHEQVFTPDQTSAAYLQQPLRSQPRISAQASNHRSSSCNKDDILSPPLGMGHYLNSNQQADTSYIFNQNTSANQSMCLTSKAPARNQGANNTSTLHQQRARELFHALENNISGSSAHWVNIQGVVRQTFQDMLALQAEQQAQIDKCQQQVNQKCVSRLDFEAEMTQKADVQDVSNAITEMMLAHDVRKEIEAIKTQLGQYRHEIDMDQNKHVKSMFDGFKQETHNLLKQVQTCEDQTLAIEKRAEDLKKESKKQTMAILKEFEKLQGQVERKCTLEEFNQRMETKLDKQFALSTLNQKPSRQEIEPVLNSKAEIVEVQQMLQTLELKFEDEFQNINEQLARRASADDLQFLRQEQSFKADKEAMDDLRSELQDRLQLYSGKMQEREQAFREMTDSLDQKLDENLQDIRTKMNQRLDELSHGRQKELVGKIVSLSEQMQSQQKDIASQLKQFSQSLSHLKSDLEVQLQEFQQRADLVDNEVKVNMKTMAKERQSDIEMLGQMVEGAHKKVMADLAKRQGAIKTDIITQVQHSLDTCTAELKDWTGKAMEDKVRVDEVQDALKKITDSFHGKLSSLQENMSVAVTTKYADNCQNIVQVKEHLAKLLTQFSKLNEEKNELKEIVDAKVDHSKLKSFTEELQDDITVLKNQVKQRMTKTDVTELIHQGGSPDELSSDMQKVTQNVAKLLKEFKLHKEDCMSFNEASLRDNCFGRWLWTRADLVNPGDFLAWDTESSNTCPSSLRWWKPSNKEHSNDGNMIVVERGGLYEVSVAFFINSAMSQNRHTNGEARTSQFGLSQANQSQNFVPQITQCVSPIIQKNGAAATEEDDGSDNPISIVHLNGSTLFSAQSTPFSAYSAANQNQSMSCILSIQRTLVVRLPSNARLQVSFSAPRAATEQDFMRIALVEGYFGIRRI